MISSFNFFTDEASTELLVLMLLDFLLGVINMDNDSIEVSSKENGMKW